MLSGEVEKAFNG